MVRLELYGIYDYLYQLDKTLSERCREGELSEGELIRFEQPLFDSLTFLEILLDS